MDVFPRVSQLPNEQYKGKNRSRQVRQSRRAKQGLRFTESLLLVTCFFWWGFCWWCLRRSEAGTARPGIPPTFWFLVPSHPAVVTD
jgi:hypothetical protein